MGISINKFVWAIALALLPTATVAAERPEWAFGPTTPPPAVQPPANPDQVMRVPGSTKTYTLKQLDDNANPPDWFPDEHPPMPKVVAHGNGPTVRACITCHVANGAGHPENSRITGASAAYLARQLVDMSKGVRFVTPTMRAIAKGMTEAEIREAADYFSKLKVAKWTRVVETDTVPKTYHGRGNMRLAIVDGGTEPIGNRIVELPEAPARVALRDPHSGFITYAPKGSIEKGKALAEGGNGKTIACGICHGPDLKGLGDVPGIAGRSPLNIARQLYYFQTGERGGPAAALMKAPVEKLNADDLLTLSAYIAALDP